MRGYVRALALASAATIAGCGGGDDQSADGAAGSSETYTVPSEAMEPSFEVGETLQVDTDAFQSEPPEIGDVITFHPPTGAETGTCGVATPLSRPCPRPTPGELGTVFLKRIVAGPGDRISIENGHTVVNGEVAEEDFITPCRSRAAGCEMPQQITVPPDHYFVMGDNRAASEDSRQWGPIPAEAVLAQVVTGE